MTKGILGVNIMVALSNFGDMVRTAVEERIDIIFSGAGLPLNLPEFLKGGQNDETRSDHLLGKGGRPDHPQVAGKIRLSSGCLRRRRSFGGRASRLQAGADPGPGFFAGQAGPGCRRGSGTGRGGAAKRISRDRGRGNLHGRRYPEIHGAGGFGGPDGHALRLYRGMRRVPGIQDRHTSTSKKEDLVIIKSPVGMPGRAIRNQYIDDVEAGRRNRSSAPITASSPAPGNPAPTASPWPSPAL